MKYLIFLLACSFASPLFLQENPLFLQDNLGESCLKNPNFNFTSFTVQYWPIYLGIPYSLIFSGVFTSEELLDQITVGIRREGHTWDYSFFNYNQNFKKGDLNTFTINMPGPPQKGSYISQVTFHRPNYSIFSCWQIAYQIIN